MRLHEARVGLPVRVLVEVHGLPVVGRVDKGEPAHIVSRYWADDAEVYVELDRFSGSRVCFRETELAQLELSPGIEHA